MSIVASLEVAMHERTRHPLIVYGIAVGATVASLLMRWPLWPVLGNAVPTMTFFPAVMIAAYFGGLWPGIVATVLSAAASNYFVTRQIPFVHFSDVNDLAALILFVLVGTIISALCESLHRVRHYTVALERRRAEEAMRETDERFHQLVENIHEVFWMTDVENTRMLYVSPGYEQITGRTCQSVYERPESRLESIHPEDRVRVMEQLARRQEGVFVDLEFRIVRLDGSTRWVRSRGFPMRGENGEVTRVAGLMEDITDRKRVEGELRESEHRWRNLAETVPQLVWTARADGWCDYFSAQWTQHTGVPEPELLGWRWMETLHPEDRERTRSAWMASVQGLRTYDVEYRVRRGDGEYRWFKTRGVPIRDGAGNIVKWFGTCTDMTADKQLAEELRQAKEAAETANRAKDEFLANVSHEIRTPMNAILGLTTLVLGTRLNDGQRQSLATVRSAANNLLGIINDLLDFSKIEAGKLELDPGEFSLRAAVGESLRALAVRAHQKGLELVSNVQAEVPDDLIGDAGRLRQILLNIVGNAIKFTEKGEVVQQVSEAPDGMQEKEEICLLFAVRDTGIGIPREKHAAIFRAFEQEDTSTTRKYGGTGLGLTISAQLAALMGGRITVESKPGLGSTFTVRACFRRLAKGVEPSASPGLAENLRVLIVDNNVTNRRILEEWLRSWRMAPEAVGDGTAALNAAAQAVEAGRPYALVLLDRRMPDTDGLAVAEKIRERMGGATRVILLSSEDSAGDTARSRESGISAHLLKPLQQSELLEAIQRVMSRPYGELAKDSGEEPTAEGDRARAAIATVRRILVAEDNEFNVILLKQLFGQKGYSVQIAGNGKEALELASSGAFDLLLLDIHMPEMDGFEVVRKLRERERAGGGRRLPVVAFTARSGKEDREQCLAAGMDDFLSKPVQAEALWGVIDRNVVAQPVERGADANLIDVEAVLGACGGDAGILERICRTFQTSVPNQMARVRAASRENDTAGLREAAHVMYGTVAAFSSVGGAAVSEVEDAAARGEIEACGALVDRLEGICALLVQQTSGLSMERLQRTPGPGGGG